MSRAPSPLSKGAAGPSGRRPQALRFAALGAYGALLIVLGVITVRSIADLEARREAVAATSDLLARLDRHRPLPAGAAGAPAGSPFLEGPTVTIAGANLLQQLSNAVARFDGRITSSRVEVQGTPFGEGFVSVTVSVQIAEPDLQKLLYDLETGRPLLFVGQLMVRAKGAASGGEGSEAGAEGASAVPLEVSLTVYGQWQATP